MLTAIAYVLHYLSKPQTIPNTKKRDVPCLFQNVLRLFAIFITFHFQCVHHQTGFAIRFYYISPEGLQVLVTNLRISRDGLVKTVVVRQSKFRQT